MVAFGVCLGSGGYSLLLFIVGEFVVLLCWRVTCVCVASVVCCGVRFVLLGANVLVFFGCCFDCLLLVW